jgi:cell division protein FtsA
MIKRKRKDNIIVSLDVGTTKICAIVGEVVSDGIDILSIKTHPSEGLKKGVVIDEQAASNSIKETILKLEDDVGFSIKDVYVGIAGSHIKSFSTRGDIRINNRKVTKEDVKRVIDSAKDVDIPVDREILHVIPTDFIIDNKGGIKEPVGKRALILGVNVFIITGAVSFVQTLIRCCEKAGLHVLDIVLQPIASAEAVLLDSEFKTATALIDIGGGTTDLAIYADEWLRHINIWGIGGNHFTNDLSIGLNIPFSEAERLKKSFGLLNRENAEIEVVSEEGEIKSVDKKNIVEILEARAEELIELIKKEIDGLTQNGIDVSKVVLTGGGSLLMGFDEMAEKMLLKPVRLGMPGMYFQDIHKEVPLADNEFTSPIYSTGYGLILYGSKLIDQKKAVFSSDSFAKIIDKMAEWFKKIVVRR